MKFKINELNNIAIGLQALSVVKMKGSIKFKIVRDLREVDEILSDALKANNNNPEMSKDIADKVVNVDLEEIYENELEDLEITPAVIYQLGGLLRQQEITGVEYD